MELKPLFEEEIPGLKTRNYVDLNNLKKNKFYYYNSYPLGYFNEIDDNSLVFSHDKYDENIEDDDRELNVYEIIPINNYELPSNALLQDMVLQENNVKLNKLQKGRHYFYNGTLLGIFIKIIKNKLIFKNGNITNNYFIIQINQKNQIPSSALLEEVDPQTIHLEDISLENDNDYFGGKRKKRKGKKTKKKSKKSKKRYSRKYR